VNVEKGYKKSKELLGKVALSTTLVATAGIVLGGLGTLFLWRSKKE